MHTACTGLTGIADCTGLASIGFGLMGSNAGFVLGTEIGLSDLASRLLASLACHDLTRLASPIILGINSVSSTLNAPSTLPAEVAGLPT